MKSSAIIVHIPHLTVIQSEWFTQCSSQQLSFMANTQVIYVILFFNNYGHTNTKHRSALLRTILQETERTQCEHMDNMASNG